jgi:DNA-binding XRE family transcriptional regulator
MIEFNGIKPSGSQIKEARLSCGLSQSEAAKLVHKATLTWSYYEREIRHIDLATWELFCLKSKKLKPKKKPTSGRPRIKPT